MTGENDGPTLGVELRPHSQAHVVGLPAKHLRVNRSHESVHTVETFWCRAGRQPFEIAVGTRDIAVRAGRDVDDDFATLRHESDLRCQEPRPLYTFTRICSVEYTKRVESVFAIIAEPNRRAILSLLVSSQPSVGEIERRLRMPQPTVSKHLRVLREAGFVESTVDG